MNWTGRTFILTVFFTLAHDLNSCLAAGMDQECLDYLVKYEYVAAGTKTWQEICEAMYSFKDDVGLSEFTGDLCACDEKTREMMSLQRCGVPKHLRLHVRTRKRLRRYVLLQFKWPKSILSWKLKKYEDKPSAGYTTHFPDTVVLETLKDAFKSWADVSSLEFYQTNSNFPDIELFFAVGNHGDTAPFDGKGGTLAHTFLPRFSNNARVHFDDDESWTLNKRVGINLLHIAIHEIGHALGIGHSKSRDAIMYAFYRNNGRPIIELSKDDINAVQALYGKNSNPTELSTTPTTTITTTITTTPTSTTTPTTTATTRIRTSTTRLTKRVLGGSTSIPRISTRRVPHEMTQKPTRFPTTRLPRQGSTFRPPVFERTTSKSSTTNFIRTTLGRMDLTQRATLRSNSPELSTTPSFTEVTIRPSLGRTSRNPKPNQRKTTRRPPLKGPNVLMSQSIHYDLCEFDNIAIDAITSVPSDGPTLVFKGPSVTELQDDTLGEANAISELFVGAEGDIDAAVSLIEYSPLYGVIPVIYIFKGHIARKYSIDGKNILYLGPWLIREMFPGLPDDIDAAFYYKPYRSIFAFKGVNYYKIGHFFPSINDVHPVTPGYPRSISYWGLPVTTNLSSAFTWSANTLTYFFAGDEYYRFDDIEETVDTHTLLPFPRKVVRWWFGCGFKSNPPGVDTSGIECPQEKDVLQTLTINALSSDTNELRRESERCRVISAKSSQSLSEANHHFGSVYLILCSMFFLWL